MELTESPEYKNSWYSWVIPSFGLVLLLLLIIVANFYLHLLMECTFYISHKYPGTGKYILIIGVPFYFFIMIVSAFAQANGYTNVVNKKFFTKSKGSKTFSTLINFVMVPFYIYNGFCIYIYIRYIL
jgi:hypothetical protein